LPFRARTADSLMFKAAGTRTRPKIKMKKTLLFLLVFIHLLLPVIGQGQNPILDSLQAVLKTQAADTNRVNTLNELSWQLKDMGNYDLALKYADDAMLIAKQIDYKKGMATAYSRHGQVYQNQGNYPEALKNHFAALKIKEELGNQQDVANSYINIGNIYYQQGNFPEASKNYMASLKINQELGNKPGMALTYGGIGLVYDAQGIYPEALKNYLAGLKISEELGDKTGIARAYNNIGNVYGSQRDYPEALKYYSSAVKINEESGNRAGMAEAYNNIGIVYFDQGNYSESLKNYIASLEIKKKLNNKNGMASSYNNIGNVYAKQGNYLDALNNYSTAMKLDEEIGNAYGLTNSYGNIGIVNFHLKKYDQATVYLNKALQLSKQIGAKESIRDVYQGLASVDSETNNWRGAYENHSMYMLYRDSLINEENTKKTVQTQMNYEFDKKEQAAQLVQEKKDALAKQEMQKQALIRNSFVGGFGIVLLFSIVVILQRNKVRKEKARSEELLLNILPAEVAEELKEKGSAEAKLINEVSVLFTDFKGFTEYSEKLTPENLVKDIHECFTAFDTIMEKHGMEKIKTIGDAYMAAGGLPSPNLTHATDAVQAALDIVSFIDERKTRKKAAGLPFTEIRIGIHTGQVVAGIVGVKKYSYDIWGDTVNTAARMESSGEAGKINISESTYAQVKTKFKCAHRGKITAKHKGEIDMYFVEGTVG